MGGTEGMGQEDTERSVCSCSLSRFGINVFN